MTPVQQIQEILNRAKISDDEIRGGIKLTDGGCQKIAARLGITADQVKTLINTLVEKLRDEHNADMVATEDEHSTSAHGPRYAYEADFMGNLTIRDSAGGEEHYVSGSEAAHLIKSLNATRPDSREEQMILQRACADAAASSLQEDAEEQTDDGFLDELRNDAGSYNFPWRADHLYGTATAAYRANEKKFDLQIISIRDPRGEEIDADEDLKQDVAKQARAFIGKE